VWADITVLRMHDEHLMQHIFGTLMTAYPRSSSRIAGGLFFKIREVIWTKLKWTQAGVEDLFIKLSEFLRIQSSFMSSENVSGKIV